LFNVIVDDIANKVEGGNRRPDMEAMIFADNAFIDLGRIQKEN
jgi:hypothetical protein